MSRSSRMESGVFRRSPLVSRSRPRGRRHAGRRSHLVVEQFEPRIALAVTPTFVADINLQPKSGSPSLVPTQFQYYNTNSVTLTTASQQVVQLFTADDGRHGVELWVTDGTSAGTQLFKDIRPGVRSSGPTDLFAAGGVVYFAADDGVNGRELWVTDGTSAGTRLLKDIALQTPTVVNAYTESRPADFAALPDGTVLFAAISNDPVSYAPVRQLWRTDGTTDGTRPVITGDTTLALDPDQLTTFGTHVLFQSGGVLWITDGTEANTVPVQTSSFESIVDPRDFTVFDGPDVTSPFVIFTADDGAGGRAIWNIEPNRDPRVVSPFGVTPGSGSITEMVRLGAIAVFAGDNGDGTGPQLWRTSGGDGGVAPFAVYASPNFSPVTNPAALTVADGRLFFTSDGLTGETSLWRTDGTDFGTFRFGSNLSGVTGMVARGGDVFFVNFDGQSRELWMSDGESLGIVREINPVGDAFPVGPINAVAFGGGVIFAADDGVHGTELWMSDGTPGPNGTALLKDINAENGDGIDAHSSESGSSPSLILGSGSYISAVIIGNAFYFAADDGINGTELWKRDGDSAPVLVADLEPGAVGSYPAQFTVVGSRLYFTTQVSNEGTTASLWVLDTASAVGPVLLAANVQSFPLVDDPTQPSSSMARIGDRVVFAADGGGETGTELWITGGTPQSTGLLKDIDDTPFQGSNPGAFTELRTQAGSYAVFTAGDSTNGYELWITDGTLQGTKLVKDIAPGVGSSNPSSLTAVGGRVYFAADNGVSGSELWVTDGTSPGTRLVKDINQRTAPPSSGFAFEFPTGSSPTGFTALGSFVLFSADDGQHGNELWRTDGTLEGTTLVKDINTVVAPDRWGGVGGSYPVRLKSFGGKVYFTLQGGPTQGSLWATDGTDVGTQVVPLSGVADPVPQPRDFLVAGGRLFFTAEQQGQRVLLATDGTVPGTQVIEVAPGFAGFNAVPLAGDGGSLYFGVDDGAHGKELWKIAFPKAAQQSVIAVGTDGRATGWSPEFVYSRVGATTIRVSGLTAIQSGFFSANVTLTLTPSAGLASTVTRVVSGSYDARSRSVLVTLADAIPVASTGTLVVGLPVQPGARLVDADTGEVVRGIATEDLEAAGYSAAFATRFQGGLRVAAADIDGNGSGDLAVAPGGVPDQADITRPGRKLAATFGGSQSRIALFDGRPTPSWDPVSIDVGGVFGSEGTSGYLVALGDVCADVQGSGVRELVVAAGRKLAVFDVLVAAAGARPSINPVPVKQVTMATGTITAVAVGRLLGRGFDDVIVATNTAKGAIAGKTTVSLLDGTTAGATLGTSRSFVVSANVESGPSKSLVDIFGFGAQLAVGDFDGNASPDLALGAGANGLGNFRVVGGEFIGSALWTNNKAAYQATITRQLGDTGAFSQVRPALGTKWRPLIGPDFFSPGVPREPFGGGFNAPVAVAAVASDSGKARLFAALGAGNQSGNVVKRFAFNGSVELWANEATFEMRPQSPGKPQVRSGIGLRLG